MSVLVPPGGDVTLALARHHDLSGPVIDVGRTFIAGIVARASAEEVLSPSEWDPILGPAAVRALQRTDTVQGRLRALALLLRARRGSGVLLRLDAVVLAQGTAERSADVTAAATAGAPYDGELRTAVDRLLEEAPGDPVHVVIERDQQMPAALTSMAWLGSRGAKVVVTGRYATAHWQALRHLRGFGSARLRPTPRGLSWRVGGLPTATAASGAAGDAGPWWRELPGDPEPDAPWAGRLALHDLIVADRVRRAPLVAVIGVCDVDDRSVLGRSGERARHLAVRSAIERIQSEGGRCVVEFWVGAPRADPGRAAEAATLAEELIGPVLGVRMFEWPLEWAEHRWDGIPVGVGTAGDRDLARAVPVLSPAPPAKDVLAAAVEAVAAGRLRHGQLIPGRVAEAYLQPVTGLSSVAGEVPEIDPDLVVIPDPGGPGMIAVNTRLGVSSRLPATLMGAVEDASVRRRLSEDKVAALRDRGILVAG